MELTTIMDLRADDAQNLVSAFKEQVKRSQDLAFKEYLVKILSRISEIARDGITDWNITDDNLIDSSVIFAFSKYGSDCVLNPLGVRFRDEFVARGFQVDVYEESASFTISW